MIRHHKLIDYIFLLRPFTLLAPVLVGALLVLAVDGLTVRALTKGVTVGAALALAQACGQVINQVADAELDRLIKPYRPIPSGKVTKEEALGISYLLAIIAVGLSFTVSTYFGLMICVMLFFAVFYSLPPLSPRRVNAVLNLLWVAFSRGFLPFISIMGISGWQYAVLGLMWCLGWQGTKDVPDSDADRLYGIKTIANTYGVGALRALSTLMTLLFALAATYFSKPLFLALVVLGFYGIANYDRPWRGENTVSWAVFYIGLSLVPVLTLMHIVFFS